VPLKKRNKPSTITVSAVLRKHFGSLGLDKLVTANRVFPATARVDLQTALEAVFDGAAPNRLIGLHVVWDHETITFSSLTVERDHPALVGPLQYDEIEVGETEPFRCLKKGLWLASDKKIPFAVLLTRDMMYGRSRGMNLEIAVPPGEEGLGLTRTFLAGIERRVAEAGSYRGRVISLEASDNYSGHCEGIKVHRLRPVKRSEIILPQKTISLLERNVMQFIAQRDRLKSLDMPVKKGLLFYGPPGTGKTHTIHYLASQLQDHTTLLITADQVGLLDEYSQLARFLQPAIMVIEDADLIARARQRMRGPCEESLLNRLLNEMDGLREDAMILFILTTNAPEHLEAALASRPGRIDQAIEFPLPDDDGRHKLIHLYARGMKVTDEVVNQLVRKTRNASPAFIKELMRRSAQYHIQDGGGRHLAMEQVEAALDEMLFSGGSLNVKLLGGALQIGSAEAEH
jgi:hypothetical protein